MDSRTLPRLGGGLRHSHAGGLACCRLSRVPAIIATIVLGFALPTLSLPGLGFGNGPGGSGPLQLTDPTLDLRRNLNQPEDRDVIQYQTTAPGGVYLRLASLPQLNADGWSNVQIRLNTGSPYQPSRV